MLCDCFKSRHQLETEILVPEVNLPLLTYHPAVGEVDFLWKPGAAGGGGTAASPIRLMAISASKRGKRGWFRLSKDRPGGFRLLRGHALRRSSGGGEKPLNVMGDRDVLILQVGTDPDPSVIRAYMKG